MRTVKWNPFLSGVCTFLGGMLLWAGAASADVSSTNAAAIVVYPKLVLDTTSDTRHIDTVIQLTNTSGHPVNVRCFLVNANGHCSTDPSLVCNPSGSGTETATSCESGIAFCRPGWVETDFAFSLTPSQPIAWTLGDGDLDRGIPNAPEDPMLGELKCIEVGDDELPIEANDLKGEATIERIDSDAPAADIEGYNAIGIQAIEGANNNDNTLEIGREYNACPNILVLDHFFDDAIEPAVGNTVRTDLTLVPCSEDFNFQAPITTVVQYLVFNEFEQRLSTSKSSTCFSERHLSDIDTRAGASDDATSMFNVAVQGTITGQTLIRGVADSDTTHGHGLLGIAEEFHGTGTLGGFEALFSAAFNLNQRGTRTQADIVSLPPAGPTGP